MSLTVKVIAPDRVIWNMTATEAILPSTTGQLGILKSHSSLITALEIGVLRIRTENNWVPLVLLGGFAEVEDDVITVLVNGVEELKEDKNMDAVRDELERASLRLENAETDKEKIEASQNLKRISAKVQALTFL
jgi:F-type H+-transporting ATPase subunit epsilon